MRTARVIVVGVCVCVCVCAEVEIRSNGCMVKCPSTPDNDWSFMKYGWSLGCMLSQ